MPEAVAAAPAVPAAPVGNANTTTVGDAKTPAASEVKADAWTPDDDKTFETLARKRGLKVRANGEEKPISRIDDLLKELEFSAKGRGASKLAEQTKAEREAAKAEMAKAREAQSLVERARRGDYEARVALGLVEQAEAAEREAELAKYPPAVRQLLEHSTALERRLAEVEAERESYVKEQEQRRTEATKAELRKQATSYLQRVVESAGLDLTADAKEARPFLQATYQAMAEFAESGLDLASDVTAEMLVHRVSELRAEASEKAFSKLKPERRLAHARPLIEAVIVEVFGEKGPSGQAKPGSGDWKRVIDTVGPKAAAGIARAYAAMVRAPKAATPAVPPPQREAPKAPERPKPLWFGSGR